MSSSHQEDFELSVLIPAHEGWQSAVPTLEALSTQSVFPRRAVVVMDRTGDWGECPAIFQELPFPVIPISALHWGGPAGTRNTGFPALEGEVTLFLDSGVLPAENLVEAHLDAYADEGVVAAACPTLFYESKPHTAWFYHHSVFLLSFGLPGRVDEVLWTPTANLSYRRSAAPELEFEEIFPVRGACEDVCFGHALVQKGRLACLPESHIRHEYWPSFKVAIKKFTRWGRGEAMLTAHALDNEGVAPVDQRRINDFHLMLIWLVLLTVLLLAGRTEWALVAALVAALHMTRKAIVSLWTKGWRTAHGQFAAWLQLMFYFGGQFMEAVRMRQPRLWFRAVRIYREGILPPPRSWLNRSFSLVIYLGLAFFLVKLLN